VTDDPSRRVTLDDVAAAAGVSTAAVSLALRGKPGVARATRQRIVDVAARLGYHVRPTKGPPAEYTIGLLLATRRAGPPERSHGPVVTAITAACADAGADVRLGTLALDEHDEPVAAPGLTGYAGINGFLVLGPWLSRTSAGMFGQRPVVLIDGDVEDRDMFSTVVGDDAGGAADATATLVRHGHRRIVLAGGSEDAPASIVERRRGYTEAMLAAGLQPNSIEGPIEDPEGWQPTFSARSSAGAGTPRSSASTTRSLSPSWPPRRTPGSEFRPTCRSPDSTTSRPPGS
jgi:DNA-binding LacI/PurR family transcriptional regulator